MPLGKRDFCLLGKSAWLSSVRERERERSDLAAHFSHSGQFRRRTRKKVMCKVNKLSARRERFFRPHLSLSLLERGN